jgi:hypothetical protein
VESKCDVVALLIGNGSLNTSILEETRIVARVQQGGVSMA